jgi:hypothetical protein
VCCNSCVKCDGPGRCVSYSCTHVRKHTLAVVGPILFTYVRSDISLAVSIHINTHTGLYAACVLCTTMSLSYTARRTVAWCFFFCDASPDRPSVCCVHVPYGRYARGSHAHVCERESSCNQTRTRIYLPDSYRTRYTCMYTDLKPCESVILSKTYTKCGFNIFGTHGLGFHCAQRLTSPAKAPRFEVVAH